MDKRHVSAWALTSPRTSDNAQARACAPCAKTSYANCARSALAGRVKTTFAMNKRIYCSGCSTSPHNEQRDLHTPSPTQSAAPSWQTDEYVARYGTQRSAQQDLAMYQH